MNQEVFQIIQSMDLKNLEIQLALQCAPLLTGLKVSNLLIVPNEHTEHVVKMFKETEISFFVLSVTIDKTAFLLYRMDELSDYLKGKGVRKLLNMLGYKSYIFEQVLITFRKKYVRYKKDGLQFPHEMGVLLGYPPEDVFGFITNKGKNFLYAGYWKVYDNLLEKLSLFARFDHAKEVVVRLVSYGVGILEIIEIFSNSRLKKIAV
ncbi:DUF3793 family protein [Anaerosacchariphilus polymeriproducens]|uniref:DUF3793 family protein n=1 Tax=Anaerosacchariphilus polymeriproducens TaxID=1812858 RepID=A0A371AZM0_9FIRM|nr:DUF3793 family protein [Anaerosacchariphilus polymeriproducens]RDU25011.1 DUF3793 family protein [Anaerosacchariphilus polymeriproducens]